MRFIYVIVSFAIMAAFDIAMIFLLDGLTELVMLYIFLGLLGFIIIEAILHGIETKAWDKYHDIDRNVLKTHGQKQEAYLESYKLVKGKEGKKNAAYELVVAYVDELGVVRHPRAATYSGYASIEEAKFLKTCKTFEITTARGVYSISRKIFPKDKGETIYVTPIKHVLIIFQLLFHFLLICFIFKFPPRKHPGFDEGKYEYPDIHQKKRRNI